MIEAVFLSLRMVYTGEREIGIVASIAPYVSALPIGSTVLIFMNTKFFEEKPTLTLSLRAMLGPILLTF